MAFVLSLEERDRKENNNTDVQENFTNQLRLGAVALSGVNKYNSV